MKECRKVDLYRPWCRTLLGDFDPEMERRGLRFARYADDRNIQVRSRRAGERAPEQTEERGGAATGA
jgi:hypothetical protein